MTSQTFPSRNRMLLRFYLAILDVPYEYSDVFNDNHLRWMELNLKGLNPKHPEVTSYALKTIFRILCGHEQD